jgi:hypothetical protein
MVRAEKPEKMKNIARQKLWQRYNPSRDTRRKADKVCAANWEEENEAIGSFGFICAGGYWNLCRARGEE